MALTVADVIDRLRNLLLDPAAVRWSDDELTDWINDAQREVVMYKPEATSASAVLTCAVGTRQSLPAAAARLLDVTRNTSSDGATAGRVVRLVEREALDAAKPDWHKASNHADEVRNYVYDTREPRSFYVYPGVKTADTTYLDIVYSKYPDELTATTDDIEVDDLFIPSVINYVLFRAYGKESEHADSDNKVQLHLQLFLSSVGVDIKVAKTSSPNMYRLGNTGARQ